MSIGPQPRHLLLIVTSVVWLLVACRNNPTPPIAGSPTAATIPPAWLAQPPTPPVTPSPAVPTPPAPTSAATAVTTAIAPTPQPTCATPGRILTGTFSSLTAGNMAYRIYLPPCYGQDGRVYPTLTMLGGNIHTDAIWDELGLDETAESLINAGTIPPFLIVMPAGGWIANNTSGGPGSYESVILDDLIPYIEQTYCAWKEGNGRAIGGLSRGGYWALEIAFRHPQAFASVGGHSAALMDLYAGPDINPQYTALTNDLGNLRIYLDIGESDYVRTNTIQLHDDLLAANIPHTWVLQPGAHDDTYWQTHTADYLSWYALSWPTNRQQYPACTLNPP